MSSVPATPSPSEPSALLALAMRAARGDDEATGRLLRTLAPRLVSAVRAVMGGGHADLDDAVQQALIAFVQALPAFRGDCDPAGYARVIAVRAAIAVRKRSRVRAARHDEVETEALPESTRGADAAATASRRQELLRDLLAELPPEQAETLALRVMFGCSLEEVAQQTGAPLNTVRSRVRIAKERLRTRIEANPELAAALDVEVGP